MIHRLVEFLLRRNGTYAPETPELVNLVILALVQIGLNVATVLGAAVTYKWHTSFGFAGRVPEPTLLLMDYGFVFLIVPVIWIGWAIHSLRNRDAGEVTQTALILFGWIYTAIWVVVLWVAAIGPFTRNLLGCCSLSSD